MIYGNLNEYASITKDKHVKPRKIRRKHSLSDSEIKLSEDINNSEFSQRNDRKNSSYLKMEGRNHILDDHLFQLATKDKQKSFDKASYSKETEKIQDRISKFENMKDKSFSGRGPVIIKNERSGLLEPEESENTGRKSEIVKKKSLDDLDEDFQGKAKESQLQQYLKTKISESQNRNEQVKLVKEPSPDFNELIAFPSDDENSKKLKDDAIKEMSSEKSNDKNKEREEQVNEIEKADIIYNEEEHKIDSKESSDKQNEDETNFPNIADKSSDNEQQKDKNINQPNSDIFDEIHSSIEKQLKKSSDNFLDVASKESDKEYEKEEDIDDLLSSSRDKSEQEILLISKENNIKPKENKDDIFGSQSSPFSKKHVEENKSFQAEEIDEDQQPNKPIDPLDIPGIPEIEHIPESEDATDKNEVENMLLNKQPVSTGPSLNDIMNDDLTGASQPTSARRSRTEDDLPGGRPSNNEKAEMLTEELMFYLMMECRNNLFPQRVNPQKLKQKTEEEIEKHQKEKLLKEESDKNEDDKKETDAQEEEEDEDLPQK